MTQRSANPVLVLLASHWLSMSGAALVTTATITWLLLAALPQRQASENPYLGILLFFAIPTIFFIGLLMMPAGAWLAKRKIRKRMEAVPMERGAALRRLAIFLGVTTLANILLAGQFTYRAVEHMETVGFCGQSCHVMQPQFRASRVSAHGKVECVACHVAPGATGWLDAKMAGTRQLYEVATNSYPRPIPSALASDRLVPAVETCERCHARNHAPAPRVRVITRFAEDQANTASHTVMMMRVGGAGGIHGVHLNPDVEIRYSTSDPKRQNIPRVEWRNRKTGETREYVSSVANQTPARSLSRFDMQCVDCHNRPGHSFDAPESAVDRAMASGDISPGLPSVRKRAVELLKAAYPSQEGAASAIRADIAAGYPGRAEADRAAASLTEIYARNVFPDLRVAWGTYPDNLGHTASPGCFRCHDGEHTTASGKSISQDCASCHEMLAVEEADPEILKKLNLTTLTAKGVTQ